MTVLVALRHNGRGLCEVLGVTMTDSAEGLDRLAKACEETALAEYSVVRRHYGEVPTLEAFVREFVRWSKGDRHDEPTVLYANAGGWHYWIERREPLC